MPIGGYGAVHYGGACFDAMDAWKYIGGKTALLPPGEASLSVMEPYAASSPTDTTLFHTLPNILGSTGSCQGSNPGCALAFAIHDDN